MGRHLNPVAWQRGEQREGHLCLLQRVRAMQVWFCFSTCWWWNARSKSVFLAWAAISFRRVSAAFSESMQTASYGNFSACPYVGADKRKRKQQPFPQALLRLWRKHTGEFGWRIVRTFAFQFCSVICPSLVSLSITLGCVLQNWRKQSAPARFVSVGTFPWQLWIYYTGSLMHLFFPLQHAMQVSVLKVPWVRARLGEMKAERWAHTCLRS